MKKFSREAEDRLIGVLRQVTHLVHGGAHPTDAIVKVARQEKLAATFLPLVVQGYNVGRAAHQREKSAGQGILDRLGEFDMARIEEVKEALYPTQPAAPATEVTKTAVAAVYGKPAEMAGGAKPLDYCREKTAALLKSAVTIQPGSMPPAGMVPDSPPVAGLGNGGAPAASAMTGGAADMSPGAMPKVADVYSAAARAKRAFEDTRAGYRTARDEMLAALTKVGGYFHTFPSGRLAFDEVAYNAPRLFGKTAEHILSYCCHTVPGLTKEATKFVPPGSPVFEHHEPYSLIKAAMDAAERALGWSRRVAAAEEVLKQAQAARPFRQVKQAAGLDEFTRTYTQGKPDAPPIKPTAELIANKAKELSSPDHMNEISRIRTQAMLTDLMANDEVLRGHHPHQVLQAYNELAQLGPTATQQPAVLRSLLRKRLATGAMEPFEAEQTAKLEKLVRPGIMGQPNNASPLLA